MNDEREHRFEELQELLEDTPGKGLDPGERPSRLERTSLEPEAAAELERLERLDALLTEAVPEEWIPAMTDRVLRRLDAERRPLRSPASWIAGLLAVAASVLLLAAVGGAAVESVPAAPRWLADLPGRVAADLLAHVPAGWAEPSATASAGALLLFLGVVGTGALLARRAARGASHAS